MRSQRVKKIPESRIYIPWYSVRFSSFVTDELVRRKPLSCIYDIISLYFQYRQISRAIDEVVIEERWMKYLNDLYHVIWEDGKLKEPLPDPTEKEKEAIKEEALQKMLGFLPGKGKNFLIFCHL